MKNHWAFPFSVSEVVIKRPGRTYREHSSSWRKEFLNTHTLELIAHIVYQIYGKWNCLSMPSPTFKAPLVSLYFKWIHLILLRGAILFQTVKDLGHKFPLVSFILDSGCPLKETLTFLTRNSWPSSWNGLTFCWGLNRLQEAGTSTNFTESHTSIQVGRISPPF